MEEEFMDGKHLLTVGSAGTGKTYVALALATREVHEGRASKIVIVRSAVPVRDIGFLPGDEAEKMAAYERAYGPIVNDIYGRDDAYGILKNKGVIKFEPTSFMRGMTWDDTIVIADEIENFSYAEVNTLMTRMGRNTRVILCGDIVQNDLGREDSGYHLLMTVVPKMTRNFAIIKMGHDDIVRSPLVKEWIINVERHSDFYKTKR
ncbi:PhoH-like phosphate starvation-inducible [Acidovorax phage ACP17]|uniref:Phosphate starvation-inducible protein n=1 Tax=Acidovorax phage ACP17 TaxID=2010329 RepID=A0A223AJ20_9CAUD|nr:PhoH-like phosphate starvation-inducible [Acidovorax phage ACP17]ASS33941.1 phosphate starvation-inducible protein [Acidovorax phage ACP17]